MKVDEFKDQLQILNTKLEKNKETIFKMTKHNLYLKNSFSKIMTCTQLPEYLAEIKIKLDSLNKCSFNIMQILTLAYNNLDQSQFGKGKFITGQEFKYKKFASLSTFMSTFPKKQIIALTQWLEKNEIFQHQIIPSNSFLKNQQRYKLDLKNNTFYGPFACNQQVCIEQQSYDKPMFRIQWNQNDDLLLEIYFFSNDYKVEYVLKIFLSEIYILNKRTRSCTHRYAVNTDGSLGRKIE